MKTKEQRRARLLEAKQEINKELAARGKDHVEAVVIGSRLIIRVRGEYLTRALDSTINGTVSDREVINGTGL